ncbi:MAG: DNA adenine methylase [Candidatus Cloacimonetes bacterium]|nr:DNA adenine methylase [Candidatus Cloacimonadota bacterium]
MFDINNRRYIGNKSKLAEWISQCVQTSCIGDSFFDVFAGTSAVSAAVSKSMKKVILNDTLVSNYVIYKAFYGNEQYDREKLYDFRDRINDFIMNYNLGESDRKVAGFFSQNYGGKFFTVNDSYRIETVRDNIEKEKNEWCEKEYNILLASLIYSMDKCALTVGHFDAFIQRKSFADKFLFSLIQPLDFPDTTFEVYNQDANTLAHTVTVDIAYLDPPYNSRQYCQFYHIYETIIKWDTPVLYGVALKPKTDKMSNYCRTSAPAVFADLISSLNSKYIIVSYNNTYQSKSNSSKNKIPLEFIESTLSQRGEVKAFSKSHKYFNAGNTHFDDHKEFLFVLEVR